MNEILITHGLTALLGAVACYLYLRHGAGWVSGFEHKLKLDVQDLETRLHLRAAAAVAPSSPAATPPLPSAPPTPPAAPAAS